MADGPPVSEFDDFVRARSAALIRAAYVLTGDQHHAEDLVQSALARTLRAWHRLEASGNAEAYTRKTMYHLQVTWWRRKARELRITRAMRTEEVIDSTEDTVRRVELATALDRLTTRQRAVLVLRFYEDKSVQETAEILGCSVGSVKSQTSRALNLMRQGAPQLHELRRATT